MADSMYSVQGVPQFTRLEAMRLYRTHYESRLDAENNLPERFAGGFSDELLRGWDTLEPYTIKDQALFSYNWQVRRVFFWALRPDRYIPALGTKLLSRMTRTVEEPYWVERAAARMRRRTANYELHLVNSEKLMDGCRYTRLPLLRCWCPSSAKEHWIFLDPFANDRGNYSLLIHCEAEDPETEVEVVGQSKPEYDVLWEAVFQSIFGFTLASANAGIGEGPPGRVAVQRQGDIVFQCVYERNPPERVTQAKTSWDLLVSES